MKYCTVCKAKYEDSVSFCPVDGEVLEDDPSSIVNTILDGQYQIESMLGKGGMGAVYRARHILLGDRVAIKVLPAEVRTNAEWLRRFRREGQAARRFRHPNAVTVYDLRTAGDGTIYMVMEYVEGHTLDAELKRRGRLTAAEAFEVLEPIMSVLNTAHAMGVVHRDLKPENIMIGKGNNSDERVVKLLDLGIAKMREIAGVDSGGNTALTMAGQVLGTPYYMSPEQWGEIPRDGNEEIDGRADIYSLGLVFYEMVAGRRPCSGATLSELRREHVSVTPIPLHEVVPEVGIAFSNAIARAIAKDRGDRQSTAGELAAELKTAIGKTTAHFLDRTVPDLPRADSSGANTGGVPAAKETASDVNAPTIITIDAAPAASGSAAPVTDHRKGGETDQRQPSVTPAPFNLKPQPAHQSATVYEPANSASSITVQRPPDVTSVEKSSKRGSWLLIGAVLMILIVVGVGVGGYFALSWMNSKPVPGNNSSGNNNGAATATTAATKEFGKYWLELLLLTPGENVRVTGGVPLSSGQPFKFHFQVNEDGYVYIIGPGAENRLTAFLTSKPATISGVSSNRLEKGADFSFPDGLEHWLELDKKPSTEDYTIIISRQPLSSPAFLSEQATGEPLNDSQLAEWQDFLAKQKITEPVTEVNDKSSTEPFVQLKVPAADNSNPIVFHIRIQHK
jgi:serine/threonine-protein kinase